MAEQNETNQLLTQILASIQALDSNLREKTKCFDNIEHAKEATLGLPRGLKHEKGNGFKPIAPVAEETAPSLSSFVDSFNEDALSSVSSNVDEKVWTGKIGDIWMLPRDHRIDLGFQQHMLSQLTRYDLTLRLNELQAFNNLLLDTKTPMDSKSTRSRNWFRHFTIEDTLAHTPVTYVYTVGLEKSQTMIDAREPGHSTPKKLQLPSLRSRNSPDLGLLHQELFTNGPFRQRLITLQGLSSIILHNPLAPAKLGDKLHQSWRDICPSFMPYDKQVCDTVDLHLSCERTDFQLHRTIRPSSFDRKECSTTIVFHITFYEVDLHSPGMDKDLWKVGVLYNDPKKRRFRECACTILAIAGIETFESSQPPNYRNRYDHWTILHLTPEGYGKPVQATGHMDLAVLGLVTTMLRKVTERWSELVDYLHVLLESSSSLLDSEAHDNLLFDNENFAKSREHFWAINCLAEFETSIAANIEQWEEFRRYLSPYETNKEAGSQEQHGNELLQDLLERSDSHCARLKRYHSFFQNKRAATIAIRDGLFSASSVIESKAATRLGENIKLLTFSIWSIQNGPSNPNTLIYVCIIVGLATYAIVFNLNLIVHTCAQLYGRVRAKIVKSMRQENSDLWRERGESYDSLKPIRQRRSPSDWHVFLYVLWRIAIKPWTATREKASIDSEGLEGIPNFR